MDVDAEGAVVGDNAIAEGTVGGEKRNTGAGVLHYNVIEHMS